MATTSQPSPAPRAPAPRAPAPSGGGSILTRKFAGLPGWAWGAGLLVLGYVGYKYFAGKSSAGSITTTTSSGGAKTPGANAQTTVDLPGGVSYQGPPWGLSQILSTAPVDATTPSGGSYEGPGAGLAQFLAAISSPASSTTPTSTSPTTTSGGQGSQPTSILPTTTGTTSTSGGYVLPNMNPSAQDTGAAPGVTVGQAETQAAATNATNAASAENAFQAAGSPQWTINPTTGVTTETEDVNGQQVPITSYTNTAYANSGLAAQEAKITPAFESAFQKYNATQ